MNTSPTHPDLATIASLASHELSARDRSTVATHIRDCSECQASLRFVRRLDEESARLAVPTPSGDLLGEILATLDRKLALQPARRTSRFSVRRWWLPAAAAAALVMVALGRHLNGPSELLADPAQSTMELAPAKPAAGERIEVRYRPGSGLFQGSDSLVLRAVLRKPRYPMYGGPGQVAPVAVLYRSSDGRFVGSFVLPDSIVYALLAVESQDSSRVDDNESRFWEVSTYEGARPSFDAVRQRVHTMMGRSWEQAAVSARNLTELYPQRVESWTLREFFDRALLGPGAADTLTRHYAQRRDALIRAAKASPRLSFDDAGTLFYQAWVRARAKTATAADSAELTYWWARLRREYPKHDQVAQRLALDVWGAKASPAVALDSLDKLYRALAPIRGPGRLLFQAAREQAAKLGSDSLQRVWMERTLREYPDSARRIAEFLVTRSRYRREGIAQLQRLVNADARALGIERPISEDASEFALTVGDARRRVLVAMGRALVAEGDVPAGIEALRRGSETGWDRQLFGDVAAAYTTAGDRPSATHMGALIVADPRTTRATADSIATDGRARLGVAGWDSALTRARREMAERVVARSIPHPMRGEARVIDRQGRVRTVKSLAGGRTAVIILWSRFCGFALDAVPEINVVADRLVREGTPVILVIDEPSSPALDRVLTDRKLKVPVAYDLDGSTKRALSAFGTPAYYVLDSSGRIRFSEVDEVADLLVQVGALRGE